MKKKLILSQTKRRDGLNEALYKPCTGPRDYTKNTSIFSTGQINDFEEIQGAIQKVRHSQEREKSTKPFCHSVTKRGGGMKFRFFRVTILFEFPQQGDESRKTTQHKNDTSLTSSV